MAIPIEIYESSGMWKRSNKIISLHTIRRQSIFLRGRQYKGRFYWWCLFRPGRGFEHVYMNGSSQRKRMEFSAQEALKGK